VQINEQFCKKDEQTGELEFPRCAVCYEDLKEKATLLPCGHLYDKDCIEKWLKQHNQCPICRKELKSEDQENEDLDN